MTPELSPPSPTPEGDLIRDRAIYGSGEMADRVRSLDWSTTSLGVPSTWSPALLTAVNLILVSPVPMQILWGPELTVFYNDAMKLFLSGKHPQALGRPCHEVWSEAWDAVRPQLEGVLHTGAPFSVHNVLLPLLHNGKLEDMYWDYTYLPIHDLNGSIAGILNFAQNNTAAVLSQQQLRSSEARAQRVLKSIGDAVIVTDAGTCITDMNPVAEALTGWPIDLALHQPLSRVFHIINETTRVLVESPADKVRRTGIVAGLANHTILIARDGREIQIDDSGAPIFDDGGHLTGIVLVFRDVDERRLAEMQRDQVTARLQQILDTTSDGVAAIDRNWNFTYRNHRFHQILGPDTDLLGKKLWDILPETVTDGSPLVEQFFHAMEDGVAGQIETFFPAPLDRWLHLEAVPSPDGIVLFTRDITELKRSNAALLQNEKLAAVGRLAASIAHEINNPLEAVTNLLYLARLSPDLPSDIKDYLDSADRELRRVSVVSSQTLRFYKQSTRPRAVTCTELFEGVLSIYQGRILNSHVQVSKENRFPVPFECFEGEIRQVLNNLIGNAIDAMHPAGGRLRLRSHQTTDWRTGRKGVRLVIADTGVGMPPSVLKKVFEAFYTTKGIGGTGLGLWVSKEIMDRHAGSIHVRSSQAEAGSGTVFTLFLPTEAVTR